LRAVFALVVASAVLVLLRIEPVKRLTRSIWFDHFRSVLYLSCFAFGLVHLFNYRFTSLTVATLLLAPLLVLPQIISGFILAFARMRLGLIWCIALHAAHNLVLLFTIAQVRPR
jgi:DMSO/TMAO reductase YedYZ heme-binding membrane subunit